ncbi:MAG: secondary thiamine-phosphate synthase enzyme YjbQ [Bacteroidota bacterium]
MIQQVEIDLPPFKRGFHIITGEIERNLGKLPASGILHVFCKHTSAGITINENADPSVLTDFESSLNSVIRENEPFYTHTLEGKDDMPAHIKASLIGNSVQIPISNNSLNLGIWQGIYICEFRNNGGSRSLVCTVYS